MVTNTTIPYLEPRGREHHDLSDDLVAELLGEVEAEGAVLVVELALLLVAEDGVGVVDLLEHLLGLGVVGVLVGVVLERQPPVALLDVRVRRLLGDLQELVQGLARAAIKLVDF